MIIKTHSNVMNYKPNPDTVYGEYKNLLNMQLNEIDKKGNRSFLGQNF